MQWYVTVSSNKLIDQVQVSKKKRKFPLISLSANSEIGLFYEPAKKKLKSPFIIFYDFCRAIEYLELGLPRV